MGLNCQVVMASMNRATNVLQWMRTKEKQWRKPEQSFKNIPSSEYSLQLENVKMESLVIVDQHATVNMYLGFVHTARHAPGGLSC